MTADTRPRERVVVVGAGPVGLITALGLARRGVSVTVIEREADVFRSPRAMGYHWGALYILEDLGLLDDMMTAGFAAQEMRLHALASQRSVELDMGVLRESGARWPHFLTLGQDRLAEITIEHLARHPHVEVMWQTEVTGFDEDESGVRVRARRAGTDFTLDAGWLVASDGAVSSVRRACGIAFEGMTWPTAFIATNVRADFRALGFAANNYLVDPTYGAVIARITSDELWRVAISVDESLPDELVDGAVTSYLDAVLPDGFPREVVARTKYRMHQRCADSLRRGRVVIAGDAAHATNPTSGYGLVGGLHDANILSEALAAVVHGDAPADILDQYSKDRIEAFLEVSSPISVASKQLIFDLPDEPAVERELDRIEALAADDDALLAFWRNGCRIESASLLTGELLSAGRNG
jgi:3-(3-hydroxy-phenyl)propionate hydroxylase/6-hydroxy-3-succinoylpyridine 3-monooxygenase